MKMSEQLAFAGAVQQTSWTSSTRCPFEHGAWFQGSAHCTLHPKACRRVSNEGCSLRCRGDKLKGSL